MEKLNSIQKQELLNDVYAVDEIGPGGANHKYEIRKAGTAVVLSTIQLQCGPRKEADSLHGVIDSDLLEIVRHRMQKFQEGPYASEYNSAVLMHVEAALDALNARVEDRIARNVLGKNEK